MKLVTLNLWGLEPPVEARVARAARQLAGLRPDVVALQEVRPIPGQDGRTTAHLLADALGMEAAYAPAIRSDEREEGLAVLARHRVLQHRATPLPGERSDEPRLVLSAQIGLPEGAAWCHVTHLAWRLDDGLSRERQVVRVDEVVRQTETELAQVLCGDFNATPDCDEIRFLRGECSLAGRRTHYQDAWQRVHPDEPGYTWCAQGPEGRARRSVDVDRRLDYIFVTTRQRDGRGTIRACELALDQRDARGDACSDHLAVMADVQLAP